jgi:hypothetical protein
MKNLKQHFSIFFVVMISLIQTTESQAQINSKKTNRNDQNIIIHKAKNNVSTSKIYKKNTRNYRKSGDTKPIESFGGVILLCPKCGFSGKHCTCIIRQSTIKRHNSKIKSTRFSIGPNTEKPGCLHLAGCICHLTKPNLVRKSKLKSKN